MEYMIKNQTKQTRECIAPVIGEVLQIDGIITHHDVEPIEAIFSCIQNSPFISKKPLF